MPCATCTNLTTASCNNPCGVTQTNTPACESLPSQIQNFTQQFFGEVIKTEVNGEVIWSLPCSLETGLPNNPRAADEGLACYFLRLFRDGIGGLTGPRGLTGAPGTNGTNAYTVTVQEFAQPNLGSPLAQVVVVPNPAIIEGLYIFIQGSGTYLITGVASGGILFVTLVDPIATPPVTVPSGSLVVPSGPQGPQGPQGIQGPAGPMGTVYTDQHGIYSGLDSFGVAHPGIADYAITGSMAVVDFTSEKLEVVLPEAGTYLINVVVALWGQFAAASTDLIQLQLRSSTGEVFYQSLVWASNIVDGVHMPVPMTFIVTPTWSAGLSIQVFAETSGTPGGVVVTPSVSHISWVRLS